LAAEREQAQLRKKRVGMVAIAVRRLSPHQRAAYLSYLSSWESAFCCLSSISGDTPNGRLGSAHFVAARELALRIAKRFAKPS
jgi:hypothetical protein